MPLLRIGISIGDPGGIGPEITIKALASKKSLPPAHYIIFGSSSIITEEQKKLGLDLEVAPFKNKKHSPKPSVFIWNTSPLPSAASKGYPSAANGQASFQFFKEAVIQAQNGTIQAVVTAPISKTSWKMAGLSWSGHTDFLSHFYPQAIMSFWSERLKVALFSHHLPLNEALKKVKKTNLSKFFIQLDQSVKKIKSEQFNFLVAGLNPHAGENGLLGSEEQIEIIPAVRRAQKEGVNIEGPYPPDVIFRLALDCPQKIVIALYHDQGLIPFKLLSFQEGVNLTLGLPFIRTSPDHGTAFDIAGQGKANPLSMVKAIQLAASLSPSL